MHTNLDGPIYPIRVMNTLHNNKLTWLLQ